MFSRIIGQVSPGEGRGRRLGFPTANLSLSQEANIKPGVYAARAQIAGEDKSYLAAVHVGERPTFDDQKSTFEVHLLDFKDQDLYGKKLEVTEIQRLREVKKFNSSEELAEAIKEDCRKTREIYADS